jgi:hypothetical protein
MKARIGILMVLTLAVGRGLAQQSALEALTPEARAAAARELLKQDLRPGLPDVIVGRDFQVSGPLAQPLKAKRLSEVPGRLLHLINPFAATEPVEESVRYHDLNPRAWASTVGWSTGPSAAPVEVTHEPTMGLVSITAR